MRTTAIFLALALVPGCGAPPARGAATVCPDTARAPEVTGSPAEVVAAYLEATAAGDLGRAAALVLDESVVFESGGNEGTWSHYREHHLGPEVAQFAAFEIRPGKMATTTSRDGSLALVTLPLEYDITLEGDGRRIESAGTATFSLSLTDGRYRIAHVHWSSRPRRGASH